MKNALLSLVGTLIFTSVTFAHDIEYTLIQDGMSKVATCTGSAYGTTKIDFFKSSNSAGYILLQSYDVDSQIKYEHLMKAIVAAKGHDSEVYQNDEVVAELIVVGEGKTPLFLKLNGKFSALRVWLKTYGQGSDLDQVKLECSLL